jgi:hypothetical protein
MLELPGAHCMLRVLRRDAVSAGHVGVGDDWGTVEAAGDAVSKLLVSRWKSTVW